MTNEPLAVIEIFKDLRPTPWSEIPMLAPVERAKRFFYPLEDNLKTITIAQNTIEPFIRSKRDLASSRLEFKQRAVPTGDPDGIIDPDEAYNQTANFYSALFNAARDVIQAETEAIREMWPSVEYVNITGEFCSKRCEQLVGKHFLRKSPELRRFYPPWHLGCQGWIQDSEKNSAPQIPPQCEGDDQYLCNPIDLAVAFGFVEDF